MGTSILNVRYAKGKVTFVRQVHDTATMRAAGVSPSQGTGDQPM